LTINIKIPNNDVGIVKNNRKYSNCILNINTKMHGINAQNNKNNIEKIQNILNDFIH